MAKNKGKYRSRAHEKALPPEEQISTFTARLFHQIRPHALKIGAVIGGLVLVLAGFSLYSWYVQRRDTRATEAFAKVMEILRAPVVATPQPDGPKTDTLQYQSDQAKKEAALAEIQRIEKEWGSSGVSRQIAIVKAGLLYDLGRWDDAIAAYRQALDQARSEELAYVAGEGLGYALEAKGLELAKKEPEKAKAAFAEALRAFTELAPAEDSKHRDLALYHQARVKALLGDRAGAIELYKKIQEKYPTSPVLADVENRLAMLEEQS